MKALLFLSILFMLPQPYTIFNFGTNSDASGWLVVNDVVMGGRSSSSFSVNEEGYGVFKGNVSLENNGGFAMVRYRPNHIDNIANYTKAVLVIKGDGKNYQFRVKKNKGDYYSYVSNFKTKTDWQTIKIPLKKLKPAFRGQKLNRPNFNADSIEEIAILIGNKKEQDFTLLIDHIYLE